MLDLTELSGAPTISSSSSDCVWHAHNYIVQCKYTPKKRRRIGVAPVRQLMMSFTDWAATAAIIVTNTLFSREALAFAKRLAQHCFSVGRDGLLALLRSAVLA